MKMAERSSKNFPVFMWRYSISLLSIFASLTAAQAQEAPAVPPLLDGSSTLADQEISRRPGRVFELSIGSNTASSSIQWMKDDQLLPNTDQFFEIVSVTASDSALYRVKITNTFGSVVSKGVHLTVQDISSTVDPNAVSEIRAQPGVPVRVPVEGLLSAPSIDTILLFHPITVSWTENGVNIDTTTQPGYYKSSTQDLYVLDVNRSFTGSIYQATATLSRGAQIPLSKYRLEVSGETPSGLPSVRVAQGSGAVTRVKRDGTAILECLMYGVPSSSGPIRYSWTVNGAALSGQTKSFLKVTPQGPGLGTTTAAEFVYTCTGTSSAVAGTLTRVFNLTVVGPPVFDAAAMRKSVSEFVESPVTLPCAVSESSLYGGDGSALHRQWYYNGIRIDAGSPGSRFSVSLLNGSLTISSLWLNDTGVYQCTVSNEAGEAHAVHSLSVTSSAPLIEPTTGETRGVVGSDLLVPCTVTGRPTPTVTWQRNADPISSSFGRPVEDGYLLVNPSTWIVSGTFVCTATNFLGSVSATIDVFVYNRTVINTAGLKANYFFPNGVNARLLCPLIKDSRLTDEAYMWTKTSGQNPRAIPTLGNSVSFRPAVPSDAGIYRCFVTSVAGNASQDFTVTVTDLPSAPDAPLAVANTPALPSRSIQLSWNNASDGNLPIIRYDVRIYENNVLRFGNPIAVSPLADQSLLLTFALHAIRPARQYAFSVRGANSLGNGTFSSRSPPVQMPAERPDAPPSSVRAEASSADSVLVTFNEASQTTLNGELRGYVLRWTIYGTHSTDVYITDVTTNPVQYLLAALRPYREYEISVATRNQIGLSDFSDPPTAVTTLEAAPEYPPTGVKVTATSSTEVTMEWVSPDSGINGIKKGYSILYRPVNSPQTTEPQEIRQPYDGAMAGSVTIPSLSKFTDYMFAVALYTNGGTGPYANVTERTLEDVPGPVSNVTILAVGFNFTSVRWGPPAIPNGFVIGYVVAYSANPPPPGGSVSQGELEVSMPTGGDFMASVVVGQLLPETGYDITIFAKTSKGRGAPSQAVVRTTGVPAPPLRPSEVKVDSVTATTARVTFIPPTSDGGAIITDWVVQGTVDDPDIVAEGEGRLLEISRVQREDALTLPGSSTRLYIQLDGLRSYKRYTLRLLAANSVGRSDPSTSASPFNTLSSRPTSSPMELRVRAHNSSGLVSQWEPLTADEWNGRPIGYVITVTTSGGQVVSEAEAEGRSTRAYLIGGLRAWTEYGVKVRARNSDFEGEESSEVKGRTIESVPSAYPAFSEDPLSTPTGLLVSWSPLSPSQANGILTQYTVSVLEVDVDTGGRPQELYVLPNRTTLTLTGLKPYTFYRLRVRASTRIGHSAWSPILELRTSARRGNPGPPGRPYVVSLGETQAFFRWAPPTTGPVTGYRVALVSSDVAPAAFQTVVNASTMYLGLHKGASYTLTVMAVDTTGAVGPSVTLRVVPSSSVNSPLAPTRVAATSVTATSVLVSWRHIVAPSRDSLPTRNYTVEVTATTGGPDVAKVTVISDDHTGIGIEDNMNTDVMRLRPATDYIAVVKAMNDQSVGPVSSPGAAFRTRDAVPGVAPLGVVVTPETNTRAKVSWDALPSSSDWNARSMRSYVVYYGEYLPESDLNWRQFPTKTIAASETSPPSLTLTSLTEGKLYEIRVSASNGVGVGPSSSPAVLYIGVAVPVSAPKLLEAAEALARSVYLTWTPLSEADTNGGLLGYKILYSPMETRQQRSISSSLSSSSYSALHSLSDARDRRSVPEALFKTVDPSVTEYRLTGLQPYTEYAIDIRAFNLAGLGPLAGSLTVRTMPIPPGPPQSLEVTLFARVIVNVSWSPPAAIAGRLINYKVTYWPIPNGIESAVTTTTSGVGQSNTAALTDLSQPRAKDKLVSPDTHHILRSLAVNVDDVVGPSGSYFFMVQARVDGIETFGESYNVTVDTDPVGTPDPPQSASYTVESGGVTFEWKPPANLGEGDFAIIGTVILGKPKLGGNWELVVRADLSSPKDAGATSVYVPTSTLEGREFGGYHVALYNQYGPSLSVEASESSIPFYQEKWFLVIVALCFLMVIVIVVAVLCCECFHRRSKASAASKHNGAAGGHVNSAMTPPGSPPDDPMSYYEMRPQQTPDHHRAAGRLSNIPRPSPLNVSYGGEEGPPVYQERYHGNDDDDDDSSSVTSKGHGRYGPGSSDDDDDIKKAELTETDGSHMPSYSHYGNGAPGSGSYSNGAVGGPRSAADGGEYNYYQYGGGQYVGANVQESWNSTISRQRRQPPNVYGYTDSESEAGASSARGGAHPSVYKGNSRGQGRGAGQGQGVGLADQQAGSRTALPGLPGFSSFV